MSKGNIYAGARQTGKTHELVLEAGKTGKYIVCRDSNHAHYIADVANRLGVNIPFPITYTELPVAHGAFIGDVLVDDLVGLAEYFIKRPVTGATIDTTDFTISQLHGEVNL